MQYGTESWRSRFRFYTFISEEAVLPRSKEYEAQVDLGWSPNSFLYNLVNSEQVTQFLQV